jgi:DNA processing protein
MAVPGPITSTVSAGTNRLIRDGAAPLLDLEDLLAHYPELSRSAAGAGKSGAHPTNPLQRRLLDILHRGPRPVEELMELSEAPVNLALDALSTLELAGQVRQAEGGLYRAVALTLFG